MDGLMLNATAREKTGSPDCRRMRHKGIVPAVIYGHGDRVDIAVENRELITFLSKMTSYNDIVTLLVDKKEYKVLFKEVQRHVVSYNILHVDFLSVNLEESIKVSVPIVAIGESIGVKNFGGLLEIVLREIEVECKVKNIPESIELDVTDLDIGDMIRVSELPEIEDVTYLVANNAPVIIVAGHVEEEETEDEDGESNEPEVITAKADTE